MRFFENIAQHNDGVNKIGYLWIGPCYMTFSYPQSATSKESIYSPSTHHVNRT